MSEFSNLREVPDTGGKYLISEDADIYSNLTKSFLNPTVGTAGERVSTITLSNGKRKVINVRTMAAKERGWS